MMDFDYILDTGKIMNRKMAWIVTNLRRLIPSLEWKIASVLVWRQGH